MLKKLFDLQLDKLKRCINIIFYIYWHKWFSIYLIKCMHILFNLELELFSCKKIHLRNLHVHFFFHQKHYLTSDEVRVKKLVFILFLIIFKIIYFNLYFYKFILNLNFLSLYFILKKMLQSL
jgi:hypothetical protein